MTLCTSDTLADYRWLIGPEAAAWLEQAAEWNGSVVPLTARMRKSLSPTQTHLVLEQVQLRQKAREKFSAAAQMFFTKVALEQATDEIVAGYKASRFPAARRVADLCCGIGGDLLGLARRGPTLAVDRHPVAALLAEANCRAHGLATDTDRGVTISTCETIAASLEGCSAMHVDPDRRPAGRRTTRVELHEPGLIEIDRLRERLPSLSLKLAPATEPPDAWRGEAEWEWISRDGQCRQLVAWFGSLTTAHGVRRATVLGDSLSPRRSLRGDGLREPPIGAAIGRYVYEPDAAVLAAGLQGELAKEHSLSAVAAGIAYLTGDALIDDAALAAFEVQEQLPLDIKQLRGLLRQRGIGRLEIKKRGVPHNPEQVRGRLALRGENEATLILTPHHRQTIVLLCRRTPANR